MASHFAPGRGKNSVALDPKSSKPFGTTRVKSHPFLPSVPPRPTRRPAIESKRGGGEEAAAQRTWMSLASFKIYELLNLEMPFCYCQHVPWASVHESLQLGGGGAGEEWQSLPFLRAHMSNMKWVPLIILTTVFALDKQHTLSDDMPSKGSRLAKNKSKTPTPSPSELCPSPPHPIPNSCAFPPSTSLKGDKNCSSKILNGIPLSFSCRDQAATC